MAVLGMMQSDAAYGSLKGGGIKKGWAGEISRVPCLKEVQEEAE